VPETPMAVYRRDEGAGDAGALVVALPSLVLIFEPAGRALQLVRRLWLQLPGRPLELTPPPKRGVLRAAQVPAVGALALNVVRSQPPSRRAAVAVCFASGAAAVYDAALLTPAPATASTSYRVPAMLAYAGDRFRVLAIAQLHTHETCGTIAIALVHERPGDVGWHCDECGESEETGPPPTPMTSAAPTLQWATLTAGGDESESCSAFAAVRGLDSLLARDDRPASFAATGDGAVAMLTQRGVVVLLDPERSPSVVTSRSVAGAVSGGQEIAVAASVTPLSRVTASFMYRLNDVRGSGARDDRFRVEMMGPVEDVRA
jgi:hypothetical protein